MNKREWIRRQDAPLYVDIKCTDCGKLVNFPNALQHMNKYLCPKCATFVLKMMTDEKVGVR